jgi:predicted acetyltransferase
VEIVLSKLEEHEISVMQNLFEFAVYDLSELNKMNIRKSGLFEPKLQVKDLYDNSRYYLYLIQVDGQLAGFVVVKHIPEEDLYYLNHFFVLRKFRRQRVGEEAAKIAFNLFPGSWRVSQFDWNVPAQQFWRKVLDRYTNGCYTESRRADHKGPCQLFSNCNNSSSAT